MERLNLKTDLASAPELARALSQTLPEAQAARISLKLATQ